VGPDSSFHFDVPSGALRSSIDGRRARYRNGRTRVNVRQERDRTSVTLDVEGVDATLSGLLGAPALTLRVALPGVSASGRASCRTRSYRFRPTMRCETAGP